MPSKFNLFHFFQFIVLVLVTQPKMKSELSHFISAVATTLNAFDLWAPAALQPARGLPPPPGLLFCSSALGLC